MKNRKIKIRKCVVCNEQKGKEELIRVVKDKNDNIEIDHTGKANGRGAYICKSKVCIEKAYKSKALNRHLKTNVSEDIYQELSDM